MIIEGKLGTTELLYACAQRMGLQPNRVMPNGLFSITIDGAETYINTSCSPLNSHLSSTLARNKYLTRLILQNNKLPNIPFTRNTTTGLAEAFLKRYKKIIAKPISGSGAHDIHVITKASDLQALALDRYILEQYILGEEMRYLVFNGVVIGVHQSEYGTSVAEDRSLRRISYPSEAWDKTLVELSVRVTHILGLTFAAVDYLVDANGKAHVLEVNAAPGLKWFHAPTAGPIVDIAGLFLEAIVQNASQQATLPQPFKANTRRRAIVA